MILGGFRFSFQGAIIGFFIGYCIEEVLNGNFDVAPDKTIFRPDQVHFSQHQVRLLILVSAILNTERKIHSKKLRFATRYFYRQFGTPHGDVMRVELKNYLLKNYNYIPIAEDLKSAFDKTSKIDLLKFLYELSIEDGDLTIREKSILQSIAAHMGLSTLEVEKFLFGEKKEKKKRKNYFQYSSLDYAYRSLNINKSISDGELKKVYRKLVLKYHPDRTELDEKTATQKFDEISKAYEKIKMARGIK